MVHEALMDLNLISSAVKIYVCNNLSIYSNCNIIASCRVIKILERINPNVSGFIMEMLHEK